jgi:hypothetical protein
MMGSDEAREPTEMPNYHHAIASAAPAAVGHQIKSAE